MKSSDFLSERMIFGALIIGGYFITVWAGVHVAKDAISAQAQQIIHDAMLTGGPLVGIIVNAIWRTDKSQQQQAEAAAALAAKAPDLSANTVLPLAK